MAWTEADIESNKEHFRSKILATKTRHAVLTAVESGAMDFVLLDVRSRDAFRFGHIPGAWCVPPEEVEEIIPSIPKDKEIVTYCSGHD